MTNPLQPLAEPFPKEIDQILARYPRIDGYLLTLFRTFANSSRFLEKCVPNLLDDDSPLPLRIREIVILRVTANTGCEYEWGVHFTVFSAAAGLTEKQTADTAEPKCDPDLWTAQEAGLIDAIDQLCRKGNLNRNTRFLADWSVEQQLEILALCGTYHTISFVANVANLAPEPFAARFSG